LRELVVRSIDRPSPKHYFGSEDHGFLDWDNLIWRFAAQHSYWLVTMGDAPHSMPVWGVWQNSSFRFSADPLSRKAKNLRDNPLATVHLADTEAVFSLECHALELSDAEYAQQFVDEYNPKYRWHFSAEDVVPGLFELVPYKAFAWSGSQGNNDDFANTATRWHFEVRE